MRREILAGSASPIVRHAATSVAANVGEWWDWWPRLSALRRWLRGRVPFTPDPTRVEWIQAAAFTLTNPQAGADCDDLVVAGNALAESIGYETRVALAGDSEGPHHVFGLVRFPGYSDWVPVDWGGDAVTGQLPSWPRVWLPRGVTHVDSITE